LQYQHGFNPKAMNIEKTTDSKMMDMLHGPLLGKMLQVAMPFAVSSILQQLFISIDVAVVGRFASSGALAAVGANTFLINLLINLFVGISVGANAVIAMAIGARDRHRVRNAVGTTCVIALICSALLLVIGLTCAPTILHWMQTPPEILPDATTYLRVYFLGVPFFIIFNFGAAILRSKGDTRRPLFMLLAAGVINTLCCLFFVIVLHWSVAGVAAATGLANVFSASCMVWVLRHETGAFRLQITRLHVDRLSLRRILVIGIPTGLQSMLFSFSNVFVQTGINSYGAAAIAGSSVEQNFEYYCYFLMSAFTGTAVTFVGQNYGAGLISRCKRVFWLSMSCGALFCLIGNLLFYGERDFFLWLFTTDPEVTAFARERMADVLVFQWVAASYEISAACLRGLGHSLEPTLIAIFGTCVFRLGWIFFYCPSHPGFGHLMAVYPISWILTGVLMLTAYSITIKRATKYNKV
jgi:putative MATE family efflux protein